jgi:pimeloyl-ACP methyl ester carboxylesterase
MLDRRQWLAAALGSALLAQTARAADPAADGSFTTQEFDWADATRDRPVPVRLYWPSGAVAPVPLMLFSHGLGGSRMGYSYLGSHWASQGMASLHVQHVGSDRSVWIGNPLALPGRLQDAAQPSEALARVADIRFALNHLLASPLGERIDPARIVAAGHSYGATTTLLLAGARVERSGQTLPLREPRLSGAIVLSAPPFYSEGSLAQILSPITLPTLHITATDDVIRVPGYYSEATDRLAVFDAIGSVPKALAVFAGGSHGIFTDRSGTGGVTLNPQVKAATQALSMAFLRNLFERDASALKAWPEAHRAILARYTLQGV